MNKILIMKLGALGDVVLSFGAIRDIANHHQNDELHILTRKSFAPLFSACPLIHKIHIDDYTKRWRLYRLYHLIKKLKQEAYTHIYDLQNNWRTRQYQKYLHQAITSHSTNTYKKNKLDKNIPNVLDALQAQLTKAHIKTHHCQHPDLSFLGTQAKLPPLPEKFILLIAGSSKRHLEKRWTGFNALSFQLKQAGYDCVSAPGPDEPSLSKTLNCHILLNENQQPLSLAQFAQLSRQALFVIGGDTGLTHLAAWARGIPQKPASRFGLGLYSQNPKASHTGLDKQFFIIEKKTIQEIKLQEILDVVLPQLAQCS